MRSGRGWLAGDWLSTGGGVLNITAAVWTAGFHWWRSGNKKRTQNVSEYMLVLALCLVPLALKYLCKSGSSKPSERTFSVAGLTLNRLRSALSPEHVDMLVEHRSLPAAFREAQICRYLVYSEADFEVFRPAGATRCTDGVEIWHGGGDLRSEGPLLHVKFHPNRCNDKGVGPPKLKFLLRFDRNHCQHGSAELL